MAGIIFDTKTLSIIARYKTLKVAKVKLENAREKGHRLQGRAYSADWCQRMAAVDADEYRNEIDHDVEVINLMSGNPVTIKASERGGPCDPSTERYWSM